MKETAPSHLGKLSNRESSFISMLYTELLLIRAQEGVILVHKLRDAVICVN